MSSDGSVFTRLIARVKALFPEDWEGRAGEKFRDGTQAISDFAQKNHLTPEELLQETVELSRNKVRGLANKELAEVEKNHAEAINAFTSSEGLRIDIELKRRSMGIDLEKRAADVAKVRAETLKTEAEAIKLKVETELTEINILNAKLEFQKKLDDAGIGMVKNEKGELIFFKALSLARRATTE